MRPEAAAMTGGWGVGWYVGLICGNQAHLSWAPSTFYSKRPQAATAGAETLLEQGRLLKVTD